MAMTKVQGKFTVTPRLNSLRKLRTDPKDFTADDEAGMYAAYDISPEEAEKMALEADLKAFAAAQDTEEDEAMVPATQPRDLPVPHDGPSSAAGPGAPRKTKREEALVDFSPMSIAIAAAVPPPDFGEPRPNGAKRPRKNAPA